MNKTGARCGDGLRPELQALFDRLTIDPRSELFVRHDGMVQAGPDPTSETALTNVVPLRADGRPASARHRKSSMTKTNVQRERSRRSAND
jgi:hypothetical protein